MIFEDLDINNVFDKKNPFIFFDSVKEKYINNLQIYLENTRVKALYDVNNIYKVPLSFYYENYFMESLTLQCWRFLDIIDYENNSFLTKDNLLMKLNIDCSAPATIKITIKNPENNLVVFERLVMRNDKNILFELQQFILKIQEHYENKN